MKFLQLDLFTNALIQLKKELGTFTRLLPVSQRPAPRRRPVRVQESNGRLKIIWNKLRRDYFPDRFDLDDYIVNWSSRKQLRTLASCNLSKRKINVAKELKFHEHEKWLSPLLYHEMCHAVLGSEDRSPDRRRSLHGRQFKALEKRHPQTRELNQWIKAGGWLKAVRSHRTREYHEKKRLLKEST